MYDKASNTCQDISGALLAAQGKAESGFNPRAIGRNKNGEPIAYGISQFTPATWKGYGNGGDIWNPLDAIPGQARYMCSLMTSAKQFPGDQLSVALALYNAGPQAVTKYHGVPPYPETTGYIHKIKKLMN